MKRLQQEVQLFCKNNELECPLEVRLLDLLSELGEVAKEVLKSTDYGRKSAVLPPEFGDEIGDLQFCLLALANNAGIDLEVATAKALEKYQARITIKGHAGSN